MAKYKCKNCPYKTNKKDNFGTHLDRKMPCVKKKIHGNTKSNKFKCGKCNKNFASNQSLFRHNKTFHNEVNVHHDNNGIINTVSGNQTNINGPIIIQSIINRYDKFDIDDLTIYEQYLSLTSKDSPYTALLDNLN